MPLVGCRCQLMLGKEWQERDQEYLRVLSEVGEECCRVQMLLASVSDSESESDCLSLTINCPSSQPPSGLPLIKSDQSASSPVTCY